MNQGRALTVFKEKLEKEGSAYGENCMLFSVVGKEVLVSSSTTVTTILGPEVEKHFTCQKEAVQWCCKMQNKMFKLNCVGWLASSVAGGKTWKRKFRPPVISEERRLG